jgi:all-trans-retinol 13,14-reductase
MEINKQFDVAVIGGGISGLVTTSLLCSEGYKVCLIEKEEDLGGCIKSINKDGHNFQTGAHHLGGMGEGECVRRVLDKLNIFSKEDFIKSKPLKVFVEDNEICVPFELYELQKELELNFIKEKLNIKKLFNDLNDFNNCLINNDDRKIFYYFQKWSKYSFNDVLDGYFQDSRIKVYLSALGPGYGGITTNGCAFTMISLLVTYGQGAYNVKGGMDKLISKLTQYIKDNFGTIYTNTTMNDIIFYNEEVNGILLNNRGISYAISCKKIISTSNVFHIFDRVKDRIKSKRYHSKLDSFNIGPSALRLFMSFEYSSKVDNGDYLFLPSWDTSKWDNELLYKSGYHNCENKPITLFCFPTYVDKSLSKKYEHHMFMTILTEEEKINESKEELRDNLEKIFFSQFSELEKYSNIRFITTNIDIKEMTSNPRGSVFGWNRGINEVLNSNILGPKGMLKNMYLTGNWGPSFGVYGAFYSSENLLKII